MQKPKRNKISRQIWFEPAQASALRALSNRTRVPFSVYVREAVDDLLKKYAKELRRAKR